MLKIPMTSSELKKTIKALLIAFLVLPGCKGRATHTAHVQKDVERASHFIKGSGGAFVENMEKRPSKDALWHKNYYSEEKRIYLSVFIFPNQKKALEYAEQFMKKIEFQNETTKGQSRFESIYKYVVNGALLYLIRGDDLQTIADLSSHFAGKE
jgi:hypothetical protein